MVSWKACPPDHPAPAWDEALESLPDHSVFQSSAWAEHKADLGWRAVRLAAREGDSPRAMLQALAKDYPLGTTLVWCRGGPVGDPVLWNADMRRTLAETVGRPFIYVRFCSYAESRPDAVAGLAAEGWQRPTHPLDRDDTLVMDLSNDEESLRKSLSGNWGHNLRRGLKRCPALRLWEKPDASELIRVYREMEAYKGLPPQHDEAVLASMIRRLGGKLLLFRADGPDGAPMALRACAVQGDRAWDLLAANSKEGRRLYASYALLWTLTLECARRGAKTYDMGGVDPERAKGVYDFKRGTGARAVRFIGEWDWAKPGLLRPAANLAIGRKKGTL